MDFSPLEVAREGVALLARITGPDGRFRYRYDADTGEDLSGYNALRHCGTIWSMIDVHRHAVPDDQEIGEAIGRAAMYLLETFVRYRGAYDRQVVVEKDAIKLGGNGLAVLALVALSERTGDPAPLEVANNLGRGMLDMQRKDGDFRHKINLLTGETTTFRSEYYTGEALFALVRLFEATGEESYLDAVVRAEDVLAPIDYGVEPQSHWCLYAINELTKYRPVDLYVRHAEKIALHILDYPRYLTWNRSTPIACRSEGLLAFVRMAGRDGIDIDEAVRDRCLAQVESNLLDQMGFRTEDGAFFRGGDLDRRRREVRIDYVQHNISSFLHYHLLTASAAG